MPTVPVKITTRTSDQVKTPILYRLAREFNVVTNVRRAQITDDFGYVEVDLEGTLEEVQLAISWLHTTGLHVEAMQRSVGKDTVNL
jgi:hypothetical protein